MDMKKKQTLVLGFRAFLLAGAMLLAKACKKSAFI